MSSPNYWIRRLKIKNFRQYRDVDIKFSQDPKKMFTTILGANGAGKTNIMNAITWCLYGKEKHLDDKNKRMPLTSTKALLERTSDLITTGVSITLGDASGDRWKVERKLTLLGGDPGEAHYDRDTGTMIPVGSVPTMSKSFQLYTPGKGWETTQYFDKSVNELLPADLAIYFLFDGEKLEEFFTQTEDTKKGIEDISQIMIIQKAMDSLKKLKTEILRKEKKLEPAPDRLRSAQQELERDKDKAKKRLNRLNQEIRSKNKDVEEIESFLLGTQEVGQYQERIHKLKDDIKYTETEIEALKHEHLNHVLKHMPGLRILDSINNTLSIIHKHGDILPPPIKDTFLEQLLEKGECVCGNDISDGTSAKNRIKEYLKEAQFSKITGLCSSMVYNLKQIQKTDAVGDKLSNLSRKIVDLEDKKDEMKNERKDIEAKIGKADIDDIKKKQNKKLSLKKELQDLYEQRGATKQDFDRLARDLAQNEKDLRKELDKDDKKKHLRQKLDFCENTLEMLTRIKNELLDDVRQKVKTHMKKYFLEFIWKKDTYDDVIIDENYQILVQHVDGHQIISELSMGEKLVLALSFMAALRKIAGFGFPLVIDTPVGRVSGEPRSNIAKTLPQALENNQITLLVTDTEYLPEISGENSRKFPSIRDTIKKHVGVEYSIKYTNGESKVSKYE